eukprot:9376287-Pyramimonas_sp.AAC.1
MAGPLRGGEAARQWKLTDTLVFKLRLAFVTNRNCFGTVSALFGGCVVDAAASQLKRCCDV